MGIDKLIGRNKEIIKELNKGNTKHLSELLGIAYNLSALYEPCKCGFISKSKENGICGKCEEV